MSTYNFDDILTFAVQIEKNGAAFYRKQANSTSDSAVKSLFLQLAEEEDKHKEFFSDILSHIAANTQVDGEYNDEYYAYLRAFVDNAIFNNSKNAKIIDNISNSIDTLDFALKMEADSIIFYTELKNLVSGDDKNHVDIIIDEEKKHFRKLYDIKKSSVV